jgi:hypothetical protein
MLSQHSTLMAGSGVCKIGAAKHLILCRDFTILLSRDEAPENFGPSSGHIFSSKATGWENKACISKEKIWFLCLHKDQREH